MRLFGEFESIGALALGVGLEEVEVVLPEPAVDSEVEVMRVVLGKLVAEVANYLGMGSR